MKTCTRCKTEKTLDAFGKDASRGCGLSASCRECVRAYGKRYYEANKPADWKGDYAKNPEARRAAQYRWREKNPEKVDEVSARWREKNRERLNEAARQRYLKSPEAFKLGRDRRRMKVGQRSLRWDGDLDELAFGEASDLAARRKALLGGEWHVDHAVPLGGKKVSGLNNAFNLAVIPAHSNLRKQARFKEEFLHPLWWLHA